MPESTNPRQPILPSHTAAAGGAWKPGGDDPGPQAGRNYVIERTSEFIREWWTGSTWSDISAHAKWYDTEPNASRVTQEEEAEAIEYPSGVIDPG